MIELQPTAMLIPNRNGIYQPSRLSSVKQISLERFYQGNLIRLLVCLDNTVRDTEELQRQAVELITWGLGMDCWYIPVLPEGIEALPAWPAKLLTEET